MDAVVTWKLTPDEARTIRDTLEEAAEDAHERAREVRGESPRESNELTKTAAQLRFILEKI